MTDSGTDVESVLEEVFAQHADCSERIEELKERRERLINVRQRLESLDDGGEVVEMRYRKEFDRAVTPLQGPSFKRSVGKKEFLAELMIECGLSLPEARGVLQTAVERDFWIEYESGKLAGNAGNFNPATGKPPDLTIDGESYDSTSEFFRHLETEYPRGESEA